MHNYVNFIFFIFQILPDLKNDDEKLAYITQKKEVEKIPDLPGLPKAFKKVITKCRKYDRNLRPLAGGGISFFLYNVLLNKSSTN